MSASLLKKPRIRAWFIDPWRREGTPVLIESKLSEWYKALDCQTITMGRLHRKLLNGNTVDIWVDDLGRCRQPGLPCFRLEGQWFYGYALIFEGNRAGDTLSITFDGMTLHTDMGLCFEDWESRLDPKHYFPQMTRVIEWEDWFRPGRTDRAQE